MVTLEQRAHLAAMNFSTLDEFPRSRGKHERKNSSRKKKFDETYINIKKTLEEFPRSGGGGEEFGETYINIKKRRTVSDSLNI